MSFTFDVKVTELAELADDLAQGSEDIRQVLLPVQRKWAGYMVREARRIVPVRTGRLRASIRVGPDREAGRTGAAAATIIADAPYAGFVEFGTVRMSPRPYLRPAVNKYARKYRDDLIDTAGQLITKKKARARLKGRSLFRQAPTLQAALRRAKGVG